MKSKRVAIAWLGVPDRILGVMRLVLERASGRPGIQYVLLDAGGETDALVIVLGNGLGAPDPARWGPSVVAMIPLAKLIDGRSQLRAGDASPSAFSGMISSLDQICVHYFDNEAETFRPEKPGVAEREATA
ncbi:MAG: hypothetical protein SGI99_04390 [Pseudomonadota bacterium]|nr:hypothetical protein [Pseudomonadota bacterium]